MPTNESLTDQLYNSNINTQQDNQKIAVPAIPQESLTDQLYNQSDQPAQLAQPDQSVQPIQPAQLVQPVQSVQPAQSDQPAQPVQKDITNPIQTPEPSNWTDSAFNTLLNYENAPLASGQIKSSNSFWDNKQFSSGYGTPTKENTTISADEAKIKAREFFDKSVTQAKNLLPNHRWDTLPDEAKGVLTRLVYQVGFNGAKKFTKTLNYINDGDYAEAAKEYLRNKNLPEDRAKKESNILASLSQPKQKSLTEQLANSNLKSLVTQLHQAPLTHKESNKIVNFSIDPYNALSPGLVSAIGARNYNPEEKTRLENIIVNNLKSLGSLAVHPKEIVRAGLELIASTPGFISGIAIAASKISKELLDQAVLGQTINLNDLHKVAAQGMQEGQQLLDPIKNSLLKPPTPDSEYAMQLVMAPLTASMAIGQKVANYEGFKDYPNIQGAAKFTGTILGMSALGFVYHGIGKEDAAKNIEDITNKADKIIDDEQNIQSADEITKRIQQRILEVKKSALEKDAADEAKKLQDGQKIIEKGKDQKDKIDEVIEEPKTTDTVIIPKEVSDILEEVNKDNNTNIRYLGYSEGFGPVEGFHTFSVPLKDGTETSMSIKDPSELQNAYNDVMKKFNQETIKPEEETFKPEEEIKTEPDLDKVTDLDRLTGAELPTLQNEDSPFFQDAESADETYRLFKEHQKGAIESPEMFTQKLINDVNRWYHGDESIDIEKVRNGLSELVTRSEELKKGFLSPSYFYEWKTLVSEAAIWARNFEPVRLKIERTKPDHSITLNAGVPLDQLTEEIAKDAKAFATALRKSREIKSFNIKNAFSRTREAVNKNIIDRSGNIRGHMLAELDNKGYEIMQKLYLSKGASSQAAEMLRQMQKEVYAGLSKKEKNVLDGLILADRMIDLGKYKSEKKFKYPKGFSPKEAITYSDRVGSIEEISSKQVTKLRIKAKAYFDWMKKPLKDMLDEGLITDDEYKNLISHNYRRIKLVEIYDRKYSTKLGKKVKTVYDSGIEALARGRNTDIFEPSSEIMALEVFNRAYGRIMNNKANQGLLDLATDIPDNPFARIKLDKKTKIPSGWQRIFTFQKGIRKSIYLSPEMSKEWINSSPELSYKMSQLIRYATASPLLKAMATGINWGFAAANLPRDIMQVWFAARVFRDGKWKSVYSPHAPIYALQLGRDYTSVFTDAALKKGRYLDYINHGGGMEFLVHQGRLFQRGRYINGPFDEVFNFLGKFGEVSETMTRLAIQERVLRRLAKEHNISLDEARKNQKFADEATFAAIDYMDFGQGGTVSKALDNGIPYLNAAIQGTRGMVRAFKPGSGTALVSTYKLAQLASVITGTYIAAKSSSPQTMKALQNDPTMQNNLCIPIGDQFSFIDSRGRTRYVYLKVPLDQSIRFLKTFFEAATDKWLGNEVDIDRVTGALKQLSPVSLTGLPPSLSASLGYVTNKNFWSNSDIWRRTEKPFDWPQSSQEYTDRTPQMAIDFGKVTGLSPERTKYAIDQLITSNSLWSHLVNAGYEKMFGSLSKDKKEQHLAMILARTPVISRFIGVTNPYSKYSASIDKASQQSELRQFIQNRGLDTLSDGYLFNKSIKRSEIFKYIKSFRDKDIQNRLYERFKVLERTKNLPERSFWLRLQSLRPDARAKAFMDRLNIIDKDQQKEVWKEFGEISRISKGIFTSKFRQEVRKLREGISSPEVSE